MYLGHHNLIFNEGVETGKVFGVDWTTVLQIFVDGALRRHSSHLLIDIEEFLIYILLIEGQMQVSPQPRPALIHILDLKIQQLF